ncbi:MAG: hypothetical protein KDD70_12915 [Bdellovibrionales bacterium]|nr:hypothetical protein [Bdellovibrionales bacterium]
MRVIITEWALEAYLNLKHKRVFTVEDYKETIRPDVERLKAGMPFADPKFQNSKFWSPANDKNGKTIPDAYKMKWHNLGNGKVQLRLLVVIHAGDAYLCQAYVKDKPQLDYREAAKLKIHMRKIYEGCFVTRGEI